MADADEVFGKDVEQETADEIDSVKGHGFLAAGLGVIADHESDTAVVKGTEPSVGDSDSVGVSAEIAKHGLRSAEGGLCVDDPIFVVERIEKTLPLRRLGKVRGIAFENELVVATILGKGREKLAAKQLCEDFDREEVLFSCGYPCCSVRAETAAGDHAVEVWMELKVLSPGVEDSGEADVRAEVFGISRDLFQCCGGDVKEKEHGETHVAAEKGFQLCGESEDHVKVRHRE